jgi:hypothetical protein
MSAEVDRLWAAAVRNGLGRWHRGDAQTSVQAALRNYPRSGSQKAKVLEALRRYPGGLTYEELQDITGIRSAQQRLSDLKRDGFVRPSGERRLTRRGVLADVYVLVDELVAA